MDNKSSKRSSELNDTPESILTSSSSEESYDAMMPIETLSVSSEESFEDPTNS